MKPTLLMAIAAGALTLFGATVPSFGQSQSQVDQTQTQPQATDAQQAAPAPIVIETTVDLTTGAPQSPQSAYDARQEAIGALAEAKTTCRREANRQAQSECLRQAQDEYKAVMARTSGRR